MSPDHGPPAAEPARRPGALADHPAFDTVMCGVDGGEAAEEAVRQAALLGGRGARLTLVSVAYEAGAGLAERALLSPERARDAVVRARQVAVPLGAATSEVVEQSRDAAAVLLREARMHDLVAVAARRHGEPRVAGIALGAVPAVLAHRANVPVLLARKPSEGVRFPDRILLATDESDGAQRAARVTAAIAHRHGSLVTVLHVGPRGSHRVLAEETTELSEATETEPVVVVKDGEPAHRIVELAAGEPTSLIIVGSRGLGGLRALGSVSERVAHNAPCSVLVVRPPGGPNGVDDDG